MRANRKAGTRDSGLGTRSCKRCVTGGLGAFDGAIPRGIPFASLPSPESRVPSPDSRRRQQGGFTLLEVLVAFIVFVLIFGAVLDALGMAMRNTRRSAEVSEAALWAQSKLDAVGTVDELEEGSDSGEFNQHYRWQLDVQKQEVERTDGVSPDSFPVELYRVELVVSWGDRNRRREQSFVTLRSKLKEGQF